MQHIITNIKFYKGLNDVPSRIYGFITKQQGSWRGCRKEERHKKIVFIESARVEAAIIPNALYRCTLRPMETANGFIAMSATLCRFQAHVATAKRGKRPIVTVKYGCKEIVYDPASRSHRYSDIQAIADMLRRQIDLEDAAKVAEDFTDSACMARIIYQQQLPFNVL